MVTIDFVRRFPRHEIVELPDAPAEPLSQHRHDMIVRICLIAIVVILVTASLALTRAVALPVVAGVIFGMVLGPLADAMVARGIPQQAAAALIVIAGLLVLSIAGALLALPVASWIDQVPAMIDAVQGKFTSIYLLIASVWSNGGDTPALPQLVSTADMADLAAKLPLLDIALSSSAAAAGLLVSLATVYFYLATRRHMKARLLRLCLGHEARRSAGNFFAEIERRVASYLGVVTVINLACGILAGLIAWAAGLSYPIFWAALAFALNYLAFVGPAIVVAALFAAGLLSAPTVLLAAWPAAAYLGVHLLEGNVVTPTIVGQKLTLSPFLVFVSFVFWLWLWGPVGAVLSTPILIIALVARETWVEYQTAASAD